jgi:hypothetical protein
VLADMNQDSLTSAHIQYFRQQIQSTINVAPRDANIGTSIWKFE